MRHWICGVMAWAAPIAVVAHASHAAAAQVPPPAAAVRAADSTAGAQDTSELLFKLGLLEGHLMIGRALIDANEPSLALPHFGHPMRELYDDISVDLKRRGLPQFDGDLVALEAMVLGEPQAPETAAKYRQVIATIAAVRATVPAGLRDNERFMLGVLGDIAAIAAEDYNGALEGDEIRKPVEYHDSRGYLAYIGQELDRLGGLPALHDSPRLATARRLLAEMQAIVGPLLPPARPVASVAEYRAIAARFQQAASAP